MYIFMLKYRLNFLCVCPVVTHSSVQTRGNKYILMPLLWSGQLLCAILRVRNSDRTEVLKGIYLRFFVCVCVHVCMCVCMCVCVYVCVCVLVVFVCVF
jgi:hypothetical protein